MLTFYRSQYGVLEKCYGEEDLELFIGQLNLSVEGWKTNPRLSLRAAAMQLNPQNAFQGGFCNCKTGCKTKRCTCRKKGSFCSSKCHQGISCENSFADDVDEEDEAVVHQLAADEDESVMNQENGDDEEVTYINLEDIVQIQGMLE